MWNVKKQDLKNENTKEARTDPTNNLLTNFILRHEDGSQLILTLTSARKLASMPLLSWKNDAEERDKPPLSLQGIPGQVNRPTDSAALEHYDDRKTITDKR